MKKTRSVWRTLRRETSISRLATWSSAATAAAITIQLALPAVVAASDVADSVAGHYLEARTSDVFTGACFANSEINLEGKEAVLAWKVDHGSWAGVEVADLAVVAVLRSRTTLGDRSWVGRRTAPEVRSLLLVDERASSDQREALVGLARTLAAGLLDGIVAVESAPISMSVGAHGAGTVRAGSFATVETRGLDSSDHLCGNETVFYPPLSVGVDAHPGVTLEHRFDGPGLGGTWRSPGKRSSFAGTFSAR